MTGSSPEGGGSGRPKFKERLYAWWEGIDLPTEPTKHARPPPGDGSGAHPTSPVAPPRGPGLDRHGKPLWTATRLQVAERMWGDGFVSPGAEEYLPTMLKVLGLNPDLSVMEIGAGLGGAARIMVQHYKCWVDGLEASPLLIEEGRKRMAKAGVGKHVTLTPFDPEAFSYQKRVDAIFSKEAFCTIHNKDGLFSGLGRLVKPRGQLLFTDYCLSHSQTLPSAVAAWVGHMASEPVLWTHGQIQTALAEQKFDVRVEEDITEAHRGRILAGIQQLIQHMERHSLAPETKRNALDEIEAWLFAVRALEQGLKCYRFLAIKPG